MKFIRIFLSIVLLIIFTIVLTVGIFKYSINIFMSYENIKSILTNTGYEKFLEPKLGNTIILNKYSEIPEVKELIDKLINQSINYIVNDKDIPKVVDADIEKIINSNYYEDFLDIKLSNEKKLEYSKILKNSYISVNEKIESNIVKIKSELFENNILKFIFSEDLLSTIYISLVILIILIIILSWNWYYSFSLIGKSMIISGGLNIILNIMADSMITSRLNYYLKYIIADDLLTNWLNNSLIVLITGIFLSYGSSVIKNIINNKVKL